MSIYEQMLLAYPQQTEQQIHNARIEVGQQIVLAGLSRSDFFSKAAFYGGTCLRIFHGLPRFSEDMDFSLLQTDSSFSWENYFPYIEQEFLTLGRTVSIVKKDKRNFGKVESAFLKDNTEVVNIQFQTEKSIKIKIEADTCPPLGFVSEQRLLMQPFSFYTRCIALSDLFAGKMHALLFRQWKNRVKGRDWYDMEWYIRQGIPLHFGHLQERVKQLNDLELTREYFSELLQEKIATTDINAVRSDVIPFLNNPSDTEIWSNEYFQQISKMIRFV
jgi:predicted nucleotidyltransferase component of viral defense system